jgi:ABC-type sugar transport system ATPase subunit
MQALRASIQPPLVQNRQRQQLALARAQSVEVAVSTAVKQRVVIVDSGSASLQVGQAIAQHGSSLLMDGTLLPFTPVQ